MSASRRSERLRVKRSRLAATDNDVDSAQQLEATRESVAKHEKQKKKGRATSAECTASTTGANDGSGTREARATSAECAAATTGANDGSGTREARATSAECTAATTIIRLWQTRRQAAETTSHYVNGCIIQWQTRWHTTIYDVI